MSSYSRSELHLQDVVFDGAISLGNSCRTAYQLARLEHERQGNGTSFRLDHAQRADGSHFFDWVIVSAEGAAKCIQRRFEGVFKRENLVIGPEGLVKDATFEIRFDHYFSRDDSGRVSEMILNQEYDDVRAKAEYLMGKFLRALDSDRKLLFISSTTYEEDFTQLRDTLHRMRAVESYHLLRVRHSDSPRGLVEQHGDLTVFELEAAVNKPENRKWEGDDEAWSSLLRDVQIRGSRVQEKTEAQGLSTEG